MKKSIGWTEKLAQQWHKWQPPSRPSKSEITLYEKHIAALSKESEVLLLGSTPELRDLCAKYHLQTTVCDWSEDIFQALKLLMQHKTASEVFIKQDWRDMQFSKKFDLILGDCVTTVVPFHDIKKVLKNIKNASKQKGYIIQRIWVRDKKDTYTVEKITEIFNSLPNYDHWYTELLFPVFLHYYDTKTESLSGEDIYVKMEKDVKKGLLPEKLLDLFSLVKTHKTPNNVLIESELDTLLTQYFSILTKEYGTDVFHNHAPLYVLQNI